MRYDARDAILVKHVQKDGRSKLEASLQSKAVPKV
jgi:hypothetical protein